MRFLEYQISDIPQLSYLSGGNAVIRVGNTFSVDLKPHS